MPHRQYQPPEKIGPFQVVILVLSVYVLLAIFAESVLALPAEMALLLRRIDDAICIIFLADFFVRLFRAESKLRFLKWGWIDFISSIPMVDFLRWGRVVRALRVFRILRALRSTRVLVQYLFRNRAQGTFATVALISVTLTLFASIAILNVEDVPQANIRTAEDALWWSVTTMTTVGYGDRYPVTFPGRVIAIVLMTAGVALFGTFTGLVASYFMEPDQREETSELRANGGRGAPAPEPARGDARGNKGVNGVTALTLLSPGATEYGQRMSYTDWLRRQVERLEGEIGRHSVFDSDTPATPAQLEELRGKVVIHTYLRQQLLRRQTVVDVAEYDTQEFVLVKRASRA